MWSPSEAAGYPLYSNPFVQYFYPFNVLLALFYKVFGGYTVVDHIRFTVLGFSIFSAGVYLWLKEIKLKPLTAFISSLIMTMSIGSLEMLRFPNAVHTLCWFPFILFAVSSIYNSVNHYQYIKYSLLLVLFFALSVTAGYPYYLYYFMILLIPYVLFYQFGFTRREMYGNDKLKVITPAIYLIFSAVIVVVLSYPYLKSVFDLVSLTTNRGGNSYEFSTASSENPLSTLGSLIYPPLSLINTGFYFGLLNLMIIINYFLNNKDKSKIEIRKWVLLIWITVIIYITYGSGSLLFNLLWHYFPFFSNLREWGRLNKILLLLIAWLFALASERILYNFDDVKTQNNTKFYITLSISIFVTILILIFGFTNTNNIQWNEFFVNPKLEIIRIANPSLLNLAESVFKNYGIMFLIFSIVSTFLIALFIKKRRNEYRLNKRIIVYVVLIFGLFEFYVFSPWLWLTGEQKSERINIEADNGKAFYENRTLKYKTVSTNNNYNAGIVADWYYKSYLEFLNKNSDDSINLKRILGIDNSKKIFLSSSIRHANLNSFFADSDSLNVPMNIIYYSGDELEIEINNEMNCYVNYIDNMDRHWKAYVNKQEVKIELLFDTFKSVRLEKGLNNVRFKYEPF